MAKSLQAQINELRRTVERHHQQHKNLKRKVSQLTRRLRTLEPFAYAEDRQAFVDLVEVFLDITKESQLEKE